MNAYISSVLPVIQGLMIFMISCAIIYGIGVFNHD